MKTLMIFSIAIFIVLLVSCGYTCQEYVEKYHRNLRLHFRIEEKENINRYNIFKGTNSKGELEGFEGVGFDDLFENAEIGDSIRKDSLKTNILLIKHGKTISYPYYCNGEVYE